MFKLDVTNGVLKSLSLNQLPYCLLEKENYRTLSLKIFKNEFDYLRVYFQTNDTYNKHTKHVSDRCSMRLNILRNVKGTSLGVSKELILFLYRTLIRSVVEYSMEAYFNPSLAHDIKKFKTRLCE